MSQQTYAVTYEEFAHKVAALAREKLRAAGDPEPLVCLDTLKGSWRRGLSIEEAAERMVDDTEYWEGVW